MAGVAADASYVHQREFARQGGADAVSASLWPLSVDGLLLLATVGLLKRSVRGLTCLKAMVRRRVTVCRATIPCWHGR
ncbi:DUF2637 domain-containing protein [Streptomyces sp. NPDC058469]|uniref:DUF2637 domain-containing protein n=1 Tax=Streptomyces sp. NPDC058469 TaxID=3346514 RepID=UPI003649F4D9